MHNYQPCKKQCNDNSLLASRFGGEYFTVQCSCGLFGAGLTPSEAMEHVNRLHVKSKPDYAPLLFFNREYLNLEEDEILQ